LAMGLDRAIYYEVAWLGCIDWFDLLLHMPILSSWLSDAVSRAISECFAHVTWCLQGVDRSHRRLPTLDIRIWFVAVYLGCSMLFLVAHDDMHLDWFRPYFFATKG
jgi:hypothetical protein